MTARRHAACAASALACILCASSVWGVYTTDITESGQFSLGIHDQVTYSEQQGGLVLCSGMITAPFVWVPDQNGTVSKYDARAGAEIARYRMGDELEGWKPLAVAPDGCGSVFVACTRPGGICRIVRILGTDGRTLPTSFDANADGLISPKEMLPWGADSRVRVIAELGPEGVSPSCLAFDRNGCLWIGMAGERTLVKLSLSGEELARVAVTGRPCTLVVDDRGMAWVLCKDTKKLCAVDTATNAAVDSFDLGPGVPSSLCLDSEGALWISDNGGTLTEFNRATAGLARYSLDTRNALEGLTTDRNGDVWACCPATNEIWRFSPTSRRFVEAVNVGAAIDCICRDDDGYLWALGKAAGVAIKIDAANAASVKVVRTGGLPYSSTAFASVICKRGTNPEGSWRMLVDSGIAGAGWGTVAWDSIKAGGKIAVDVRTADAPESIAGAEFRKINSGEPFAAPNGRFMELRVRLETRQGVSPVLRGLHVEGANLPPNVSSASASPPRLMNWNHRLEPVEITGVKDPEGDPVQITITSIKQDEPVSGLSKDDKWPDATGVGTSVAMLRGECGPGTDEKPGNGRVYTIAFRAVDSNGAASSGKVQVIVPHGALTADAATDDGQKFDSSKVPEAKALASLDTEQMRGYNSVR